MAEVKVSANDKKANTTGVSSVVKSTWEELMLTENHFSLKKKQRTPERFHCGYAENG